MSDSDDIEGSIWDIEDDEPVFGIDDLYPLVELKETIDSKEVIDSIAQSALYIGAAGHRSVPAPVRECWRYWMCAYETVSSGRLDEDYVSIEDLVMLDKDRDMSMITEHAEAMLDRFRMTRLSTRKSTRSLFEARRLMLTLRPRLEHVGNHPLDNPPFLNVSSADEAVPAIESALSHDTISQCLNVDIVTGVAEFLKTWEECDARRCFGGWSGRLLASHLIRHRGLTPEMTPVSIGFEGSLGDFRPQSKEWVSLFARSFEKSCKRSFETLVALHRAYLETICVLSDISERKKHQIAIADALYSAGAADTKEISERVGCTTQTVLNTVNALVERRLVVSVGMRSSFRVFAPVHPRA